MIIESITLASPTPFALTPRRRYDPRANGGTREE